MQVPLAELSLLYPRFLKMIINISLGRISLILAFLKRLAIMSSFEIGVSDAISHYKLNAYELPIRIIKFDGFHEFQSTPFWWLVRVFLMIGVKLDT